MDGGCGSYSSYGSYSPVLLIDVVAERGNIWALILFVVVADLGGVDRNCKRAGLTTKDQSSILQKRAILFAIIPLLAFFCCLLY